MDCRKERGTGEPFVVLQELLLGLWAPELHKDPDLWASSVKTFFNHALEDPHVDVLNIWRPTIPVERCNKDLLGRHLLRVMEQDQLSEGLLHPLGQLLHLPLVRVRADRRSAKGSHQGATGALEVHNTEARCAQQVHNQEGWGVCTRTHKQGEGEDTNFQLRNGCEDTMNA